MEGEQSHVVRLKRKSTGLCDVKTTVPVVIPPLSALGRRWTKMIDMHNFIL